ncbi:MAG: hypothetical protein E7027_04370 [Elusimicrobium sp.]|uniref:Uncharacterized protein n=1 Tax=Candidatus Avelusimicrobium gallicola TaxID=2562704 RepID=A0A928DQQ3_9BACT|nr:hypothetical protein [Elusimicrobium sp.]
MSGSRLVWWLEVPEICTGWAVCRDLEKGSLVKVRTLEGRELNVCREDLHLSYGSAALELEKIVRMTRV